jgi:hypothetical protein
MQKVTDLPEADVNDILPGCDLAVFGMGDKITKHTTVGKLVWANMMEVCKWKRGLSCNSRNGDACSADYCPWMNVGKGSIPSPPDTRPWRKWFTRAS